MTVNITKPKGTEMHGYCKHTNQQNKYNTTKQCLLLKTVSHIVFMTHVHAFKIQG